MRGRLDQLVVERGLAPSRTRAQSLIMAGALRVEGLPIPKPGSLVKSDVAIEPVLPDHPYVSRGGVKLAHALDAFGIDPRGLVCLDIGSSTGGFTDCLLQRGAVRVYAVDVGKQIIDPRLRAHPRVVLLEDTNARYLSAIPERADLFTMDVSFISATLILPAVKNLLVVNARGVVLVKPQFELPARDNRKGVVRNPAKQAVAVDRVKDAAVDLGFRILGEVESPIKGPKGNREFFIHLST